MAKLIHEFEVSTGTAYKHYDEGFGRDLIDFKTDDKKTYFSDKDEEKAKMQALELAEELIDGRDIAATSLKELANGRYDVVTVNHSVINEDSEEEESFFVVETIYIKLEGEE